MDMEIIAHPAPAVDSLRARTYRRARACPREARNPRQPPANAPPSIDASPAPAEAPSVEPSGPPPAVPDPLPELLPLPLPDDPPETPLEEPDPLPLPPPLLATPGHSHGPSCPLALHCAWPVRLPAQEQATVELAAHVTPAELLEHPAVAAAAATTRAAAPATAARSERRRPREGGLPMDG